MELRLAAGTPFETTLETAERFADAARAVNEEFGGTAIHTVSVIAGATAPTHLRSEESRIDSHVATVRAQLVETPPRSAAVGEIERAWRRQIGEQSYLEEVEFQTTRVHIKPDVAYAHRGRR